MCRHPGAEVAWVWSVITGKQEAGAGVVELAVDKGLL